MKELVDDYQSKTKSNQNIQSIGMHCYLCMDVESCLYLEDIKKFVENYPEFKKLSGNVTKHVVSCTLRLLDIALIV